MELPLVSTEYLPFEDDHGSLIIQAYNGITKEFLSVFKIHETFLLVLS